MLIQIKDGKPFEHPVSNSNFRMLYPNVSFPLDLKPEDVEPYGFAFYEFTEQPPVKKYEKIEEVEPVKGENGVYQQTYAYVPMSDEEKRMADEFQANFVRSQRNLKLLTSDWTQLPNSPANSEIWEEYRQKLRNISTQEGFPWEVEWPEEPSIS